MQNSAALGTKAPWTFAFFVLGFFTCTWDKLLTIPVAGFHFKIHQAFFLLAFVAAVKELRSKDFLHPLRSPFAYGMLAIVVYYAGTSPWSTFPLKSAVYSSWLGFQLLCLWLTVQNLARVTRIERFVQVVWFTLLFLTGIVFVDQIAYHYGYIGGFLGYNQDILLHWGVSRPHAFASEPSFLATFLSLGILTIGGYQFKSMKRKSLACGGIFAVLVAIVFTTSRTGLFNIVLGLGLMVLLTLLGGRRIPVKVLGAAILLVALAATTYFVATPASERALTNKRLFAAILNGKDGSGYSRLHAHVEAWKMARETNWRGTGMGASYRYFIEHGGVDLSEPNPKEHFGNELIMSTWGQLLAEGGIVAVGLYFFIADNFIVALWRRWKNGYDILKLGALTASIVWFFFAAFWLGNICRGDIWVWYAIWGAIATGGNFVKRTPSIP
jgi:hypothetical protein